MATFQQRKVLPETVPTTFVEWIPDITGRSDVVALWLLGSLWHNAQGHDHCYNQTSYDGTGVLLDAAENDYSATLDSTHYLQTPLTGTALAAAGGAAGFTLVTVAKRSTDGNCHPIGNYTNSSTAGCAILFTSTTVLAIYDEAGSFSAVSAAFGFTDGSGDDTEEFQVIFAVFEPSAPLKVKRFSVQAPTGESGVSGGNLPATLAPGSNSLRIGRDLAGAYVTSHHVALAGCFAKALTDAEMLAAYGVIKAFLAANSDVVV